MHDKQKSYIKSNSNRKSQDQVSKEQNHVLHLNEKRVTKLFYVTQQNDIRNRFKSRNS